MSETTAEARDALAGLLATAIDIHANEIQVTLEDGVAHVTAAVRGERLDVARWPAERCPALLEAAYRLCDGTGNDYSYGKSHSLRMTGERFPLPPGVTMILVQFLPPRDGARHLVARITREADVCCGSCGG